jgi:hypothetical protein
LLRNAVDMNLIMIAVVAVAAAAGVGAYLEVVLTDAVAVWHTLVAFAPVAGSSWPVPMTGARRISIEDLA